METRTLHFSSSVLMDFTLNGGVIGGANVLAGGGRVHGAHGSNLIINEEEVVFSDANGTGLTPLQVRDQIQAATSATVCWIEGRLGIAHADGVTISEAGTANALLGFSSVKPTVGTAYSGPGGTAPTVLSIGGSPDGAGFSVVVMSSGGSAPDPGELLLQSADVWVDADRSTVTTVDIAGPVNMRAATNFTSNAVLANITGPDGELGVSIQESNGTVGAHLVRWNPPTNLSYGYVEILRRFKTTESCALNHLGVAAPQRWQMSAGSGGDPQYTYLTPPSLLDDGADLIRLVSNNINRCYSCEIVDVVDGWEDVTLETHLFGASSAGIFVPAFRTASVTGNNAVVAEVASVEYRQKRVSQVTDVRDATVRLTEGTNAARQVLAPTLWNANSKCFVEAWNTGTNGKTPITDASVTPDVLGAVLHVGQRAPGAIGKVLRIGDIEAKVGTDGQWHITQSASDTDTGVNVAAVPVCAVLRVGGGSADLFVDGELIGSAAYTQGSTGYAIAGDRAEVIWKSAVAFEATKSDAEIAQFSATMRTRAGLPAVWPLVIWSGQSNAIDYAGSFGTRESAKHGLRRCPGWAMRVHNDGSASPIWLNGVTNEVQHADYIGSTSGWIKAAQTDESPCAILACAKGGTGAIEWLEGGYMWDHTLTAVAAAIAAFGTHLVEVDTWVWIQGESEASGPSHAEYLTRLNAIRSQLHAEYGAQVKWVGLRLSEFVDLEFDAEVRATQDAFAAAHDDVVYVTPTADPAAFADAGHYHYWAKIPIGEALYAARQTL